MKFIISSFMLIFLLNESEAQSYATKYFSEYNKNGIIIQNSFPKGGPYPGSTKHLYNNSYLVFYSRVQNRTKASMDLSIHFSADSLAIPGSPGTFMKLFLPSETMTKDKQPLFSYGFTEIESFHQSTEFRKLLKPGEDCYFYVVAFFYQTDEELWSQGRGGNRGELIVDGENLYYKMSPQLNQLACGKLLMID